MVSLQYYFYKNLSLVVSKLVFGYYGTILKLVAIYITMCSIL